MRIQDKKLIKKPLTNLKLKNTQNIFPTVNLAYQFSNMQSLTFGYSKRVRRPRVGCKSFARRNSVTSFRRGNPFLDPTFTSAFEIDYLKRFKKFTLNTSIFFKQSNGNIERITEETGEIIDLIRDARRIR